MISAKSESDITSLAPSSPSRPAYYVQSPSRCSNDGDKSSATPNYNNSPVDSPSRSSFGHHSRNSSASRFSGVFRSSSGRKPGKKQSNEKGWPECNVIMEEGAYDEMEERVLTRRVQAAMALLGFIALFTVLCLIIWGASRPFKPEVAVKSLAVHNLYVGEGTDSTGVPTKLLTMNSTLKLSVFNPATLFGIHVTSTPVDLVYSEIVVATGQLKKYYQPRSSRRTVLVKLEGVKVPMYGAGSSLSLSSVNRTVPLRLVLEIRSRGYVVGRLVRTTHVKRIACSAPIDSISTKTLVFNKRACTYDSF